MSLPQISRNADLRRLRDEGFEVTLVGDHLVVGHVPYADSACRVRYGTLVSELTLNGDLTSQPSSHVVHFAGDMPCDRFGAPMSKLVVDGQPALQVTADLVAAHMFSHKPTSSGVYPNYYEKMTAYVAILASQAQAIDPEATAQTYRPLPDEGEDPVFNYLDTASSRAGITVMATKLAQPRVAIIGLGGSGAYILDYIAKTPIREIHLFDGDYFFQHNAFRAPGAPTIEQLQIRQPKVEYWAEIYSPMRRGIIHHPYAVDESNIGELTTMSFVFVAVDNGPAKKVIIDGLEAVNIPFIDVGMGLYEVDGRLAGLVRTTLSTEPADARDKARARISTGVAVGDQVYASNIQIAELNALNAAYAVIAWKKYLGFYNDLEHERFSAYTIDTNTLISEDQA
jgi:Domain of unknown function (DUF6791)/ThiF family